MTDDDRKELRKLVRLQTALEEEFNFLTASVDAMKEEMVTMDEHIKSIDSALKSSESKSPLHKVVLGLFDIFFSRLSR